MYLGIILLQTRIVKSSHCLLNEQAGDIVG